MIDIDIQDKVVEIDDIVLSYSNTSDFSCYHTPGINVVDVANYYEREEGIINANDIEKDFFDLIKDHQICTIPNEIQFDIYNYWVGKVEKPIEKLIFPYNMLEFLKTRDKFYVIFSKSTMGEEYENWESQWTFEYYFEIVSNVSNQYDKVEVKEANPMCKYKDLYKWLSIEIDYDEQTTINDAFNKALIILKDIIEQTENSLHEIVDYINLIKEWEESYENTNEYFWQDLFENYSWIISQCFSTPHAIFEPEAYLGGMNVAGKEGNFIDYTYKNTISDNISLIEIKTPSTNLIGREYRNTYTLSADLTGAVNQLLKYKDVFQKQYYEQAIRSDEKFRLISPRCILIIGLYKKLSDEQKECFELFRNEVKGVEIITFDELLKKIKYILCLFEK